MNLSGKNTDELAQMRSDVQNTLLELNEHLTLIGQSLQHIKLRELELQKEKTETAWELKLKRREYQDTKIKLDMIENQFWATKRGSQ